MQTRQKLLGALAIGGVALGALVGGRANATTGPAPHTLVNVVISDSSITLSKKYTNDITFVDFYIHNTGKLSHTLVMGQQESVVLKGGQREHFFVGFPVFGWYRYHVGLHGKPQQKGRFHIDSPQPPD